MPRTPAGKAAVSRNALKHGITSTHPVIPGIEQESDWRHHLDGIVASLAPEGTLEEAFAERIANLLWRLRRVTRYEVAAIKDQRERTVTDLAIADAYIEGTLATGELPNPAPDDLRRALETRIIPTGDALDKIMRYEAHLHRQCLQTLHEIEALQAHRRGEPTYLGRVDFSGPPLA